jgi:hypothetical protein
LKKTKFTRRARLNESYAAAEKKKHFYTSGILTWDFFEKKEKVVVEGGGENLVVPSHPLLNHNGFGNDMIRELKHGEFKIFQIPSRIRTSFFPEFKF